MLWQWRNGVWILNKVYVIGMGPGAYEQMTVAAVEALKGCDVIVGYTVYVDLMKKYFPETTFFGSEKNFLQSCVLPPKNR